MRRTVLRVAQVALLGSLAGCTTRGLPTKAAEGVDLAMPPADAAMARDLATATDLAMAPQTITIEFSSSTGDLFDDSTGWRVPLPTPTTPPIDGISYVYRGFRPGQYEFKLAWQDTANGNQGWTASFGGAPGLTNGWPLTRTILTMPTSDGFGPYKVALVANSRPQPNTLIISVRRVDAPDTDYGILSVKLAGE